MSPNGGEHAGLTLLGIRHHGPGSARSVIAALDALQPEVVLVELAYDTTAALGWIGTGLEPPVAILGYATTDPSRAVFAPLAEFSPEWQAIKWANDRAVPVQAIDLPFSNTIGLDAAHQPTMFDDRWHADPIGALAHAAGHPDPERWWEDVIERRGDGIATFAAVHEAMCAVRAGVPAPMAEQRREAFMRKQIRAATKHYERLAVVCGAWHTPALDLTTDVPTAAADARTLRGLPRLKVAVSWVPWSYERLATGTGYAAGVRSPGWYQHVFASPGADAVPTWMVDAARRLRETGLAASPDDLIAATRLADALSALRDRPAAGLDEVLDAASAVMGGFQTVQRDLVIGFGVGSVPDGAPQVPLARDVAKRQRSARLRPTTKRSTRELDLRTPNGRRRSHLLHQFQALGIGWGEVVDGRGSTGTFRETWDLRWDPEFAVRLVALAGNGTTLETVAAACLVDRARGSDNVVAIAAAIERALLADLPSAVDELVVELERRAARTTDVAELMQALTPLAQAQRYGDVRATDQGSIAQVVDGLVTRILAGLEAATRFVNVDAATVMVGLLTDMQHALALIEHPARNTAFVAVLEQLAGRDRAASPGRGLIQGRATRLLFDAGSWSADTARKRLGVALTAGTPAADGAAFVEGFVADSGTILVHDDVLRSVIDEWLCSLNGDTFEQALPLLRRSFGGFSAAERRQLGSLVAGSLALDDSIGEAELDSGRVELALATVRTMLGIGSAT